jgi:hypothetical protein
MVTMVQEYGGCFLKLNKTSRESKSLANIISIRRLAMLFVALRIPTVLVSRSTMKSKSVTTQHHKRMPSFKKHSGINSRSPKALSSEKLREYLKATMMIQRV